MSPIRPENLERYPEDWPEISHRIRFVRAGGRCECVGQCGTDHEEELSFNAAVDLLFGDEELAKVFGDLRRCMAEHGRPHPVTDSKVVLTTAHLNHVPEDCSEGNLMAACQRCHLRYDREHHAATRAETRATLLASSGQGVLL